MEKILQWSIAANSGDKETLEKIGAPDPEQMARLFGAAGPDEPTLMKQNLNLILHPEADLENKEIAFDNFEMLIEQLDNANNIQNMKMWPSVLSQLDNPEPSLRRYAASVVGTAVQNNPDCQNACLQQEGVVESLLRLASEAEADLSVRNKGLYALSSLVRNNETGIAAFAKANGWALVGPLLASSTLPENAKMRALNLLSALLSLDLSPEAIKEIQASHMVRHISGFLNPQGHSGCLEKAFHLLAVLVTLKYPFLKEEVADISHGFKAVASMKDQFSEEDFQTVKQVTV